MTQSVLMSVTGVDRPGVTSAMFGALPAGLQVLDVEQVVVDGLLTLGVLLEVPKSTDWTSLVEDVTAALQPFGMSVTSVTKTRSTGTAESAAGRLTVTVLGAPLTAAAMQAVASKIAGTGANIDRIDRIASYPVTALQLRLSGGNQAALREALAGLSTSHGIDTAVQLTSTDRRGRQLVVMDVDSTVILDEVVELLAEHAGAGDEVKKITASAMAGELDFEASLRARVKLLAGLSDEVFTDVYRQLRLTPGARTLCRVLNNLGYEIALVSGGFTQVVAPLAGELGVREFLANDLEVIDGKLTGEVLGEVVDRAGKAAALRRFAEHHGIPLSRVIAIGDGANDLDMLAAAGLGIAFNAKPVVQASADASVNVPYLDSVLYLLGITREEIEAVS